MLPVATISVRVYETFQPRRSSSVAKGVHELYNIIMYEVFCFIYHWHRMLAGVVPRVLWISFGGFVFLGAYEKASVYLQTWQGLPSHSHHR